MIIINGRIKREINRIGIEIRINAKSTKRIGIIAIGISVIQGQSLGQGLDRGPKNGILIDREGDNMKGRGEIIGISVVKIG